MNGLNPLPCDSYRLQDRFICAKCGCPPDIKKAKAEEGMVTATLTCHGEEQQVMLQKSELVFTQYVFER